MTTFKRIAVKSLCFGAGFAITAALIGVGVTWYMNRSVPWDTESITTKYSHMGTKGERNVLVFYYTLSNNTNSDYSISEHSAFPMFASLKDFNQLSGSPNEEFLVYQKPIFIPSGHKLRFTISLDYPYPVKEKKKQTDEERKLYRKSIETYLNKEFKNLNGFALFDKNNHYKIIFNKGWHDISDEEE